MEADLDVRENADASRYELYRDGRLIGIADYRATGAAGATLVIPHTEIIPELRGQGYGDELVRRMLDDVRRTNRTIVPRCWFVADYVRANPAYADLVATA